MKQRADFIIPECYVDTNLVETLVEATGCNHQKGCNQVVKVMQEKFADRFAIGIIDADKRRPSYVNDFMEIDKSEHLQLLKHPRRPHYIVLVNPAIDGFILSCAERASVDMANHGLAADLKSFTTQTKNVMSNKDSRFKSLFRQLENEGEILLLKSVLNYLSRAGYAASEQELKALFAEMQF